MRGGEPRYLGISWPTILGLEICWQGGGERGPDPCQHGGQTLVRAGCRLGTHLSLECWAEKATRFHSSEPGTK